MGEAQGKKVARPPLRHRRSRRSRPSARSGHPRQRAAHPSRTDPGKYVAALGQPGQDIDSLGRAMTCRVAHTAASIWTDEGSLPTTFAVHSGERPAVDRERPARSRWGEEPELITRSRRWRTRRQSPTSLPSLPWAGPALDRPGAWRVRPWLFCVGEGVKSGGRNDEIRSSATGERNASATQGVRVQRTCST